MGFVLRILAALGSAFGLYAFFKWRRRTVEPIDPGALIVEPALPVVAMRQPSDTIRLHWRQPAETVQIYVGSSFDAIDRTQPVATVSGHVEEVTLLPPDPQTRYYFEVVFDHDTLLRTAERIIRLPSIANLRDIGGYPTADGRTVRWDRVYRSATLAFVSREDTPRLVELGIQLVCDLRSPEEVEADPDRLVDGMRRVHIPAQTQTTSLQRLRALLFNRGQLDNVLLDIYVRILIDDNPQMFGHTLRLLADETNLPAMIHCTAGKDRTGIATALLLSLLGVPRDIVVADYTLSNLSFAYFLSLSQKAINPLAYFGISEDELTPLLVADARIISAMLDHIDRRYGSVRQYLRNHAGLTEDTITHLSDHLLV